MAVICPECDSPMGLDSDEMEVGETVQCDECGADLEVVGVDPVELMSLEEPEYDDEEPAHMEEEDE